MIVSVCVSLAAPVPMPVKLTVCTPVSSLIVTLLMAASAGTSFTAFTVTVKVRITVLFAA